MQNVQVHINVYCALQIGYFKAKKMFFQVDFVDIPAEDLEFVMHHYFHDRKLLSNVISNYEYYAQHKKITKFFGYQSWSKQFLDTLSKQADTIIKRDISPNFIARELIAFLDEIKVVRPAYTPLQIIVSQSLTNERKRICEILNIELNEEKKLILDQLMIYEDSLSKLAALKQDARNFGFKMMFKERQKQDTLEPLYKIAKEILPKLGISKQNIDNYVKS